MGIRELFDTPESRIRIAYTIIDEEVEERSRQIRLNAPLTIEEKIFSGIPLNG